MNSTYAVCRCGTLQDREVVAFTLQIFTMEPMLVATKVPSKTYFTAGANFHQYFGIVIFLIFMTETLLLNKNTITIQK